MLNLINSCANITGGGLEDNIKKNYSRWIDSKYKFIENKN